MAYFVNWAGMDPSLIPAANLTHVFYAFASIDPTTYKVWYRTAPHSVCLALHIPLPVIWYRSFPPAFDVTQGLDLHLNSALENANPYSALTHHPLPSLSSPLEQVVPSVPAVDVTQGLYLRFNSALKAANPTIKTLLSIGGESAGTTVFADAASSASSRSAFIQSAIVLAHTYNFDGLDID
ncbi:unnamed protein product [Closterium sp. NIES-65]|nr:unnamed protein product [Closterium sp. NIES-65]CAI5992636.1 unnamed protein product [Closterium sp. NIES-65]